MLVEVIIKGGVARQLVLTAGSVGAFHPAINVDKTPREIVLALWAEVDRASEERRETWFGPDCHGNMVSARPLEVAGFVVEART